MKDELIGNGLATVQYVVHGDVLVVPVGWVYPLDADRALGTRNAFMLSYQYLQIKEAFLKHKHIFYCILK